MTDASAGRDPFGARAMAVVLHDLAWLLPRTIGAAAAQVEPMRQSELEIMRLLSRHEGLSVTEVAAQLGLLSSNVSEGVRALTVAGLVERRGDGADGRVTRLFPTPAAIAARERRERSWGEALASELEGLDDDVRATLIAAGPALRALADGLYRR